MKYKIFFLNRVNDFISKIPENDRAKINAARVTMESGDFESLEIKTLKTPIKELIIKRYRLLFFINKDLIYFVNAFMKKTQKTPKNEIIISEKLFRDIVEFYKN